RDDSCPQLAIRVRRGGTERKAVNQLALASWASGCTHDYDRARWCRHHHMGRGAQRDLPPSRPNHIRRASRERARPQRATCRLSIAETPTRVWRTTHSQHEPVPTCQLTTVVGFGL